MESLSPRAGNLRYASATSRRHSVVSFGSHDLHFDGFLVILRVLRLVFGVGLTALSGFTDFVRSIEYM